MAIRSSSSTLLGRAGLTLLLTASATLIPLAASASGHPDPAPGGPQRPFEPDVDGPRNLDSLQVAVTREPGTRNGVTVAFDRTSRTADGSVPAAARRFVFLFDPAISFNLAAFPTCAADVLRTEGVETCPADALVGEGTSTDIRGNRTPVHVVNTLLGTGEHGLLVFIPSSGVLLEQTLERVTLPYRTDYRWALDEIIPISSVPPQERAGTSRFQLSFGATRTVTDSTGRTRVVSLVESHAPDRRQLQFGLWSHFVTGQTVLPTDTTRTTS